VEDADEAVAERAIAELETPRLPAITLGQDKGG
jgi:hypothetical protein